MNFSAMFFYDNSTGVLGTRPSGVTITNGMGHLVEAETDCCAFPVAKSNIITDEWFSYDADGRQTSVYESTPHSGGYYQSATSCWPNGTPSSLSLNGLPSISYGVDGEGRVSTAAASSGQNPLTATNYNAASQVTKTTFGSGDGDEFFFDSLCDTAVAPPKTSKDESRRSVVLQLTLICATDRRVYGQNLDSY